MKNTKNILLFIGLVVVAVLIVFAFNGKMTKTSTPNNTTTTVAYNASLEAFVPAKMTLFYSETCPHCKIVSEYITANKIKDKIEFEEKEVSKQENVQALLAVVQKCELPQENIGVPFLWTGSECLSGDQDIVTFFESYNK